MAAFRILLDFGKFAPAALRIFASGVLFGITKNPAFFPDPPISMDALAAEIDKYGSLIAESLDGSRKVMAARDSVGAILVNMLTQLVWYVVRVAADDELIIVASGFHYVSTRRTQRPPRNAGIRKLEPGDVSGTMKLRAMNVEGAFSYEVRIAKRTIDRSPLDNEWTYKQFSDTRKFFIITGLTPGTAYVFQVRALMGEQFTDWSDAVTQMCV